MLKTLSARKECPNRCPYCQHSNTMQEAVGQDSRPAVTRFSVQRLESALANDQVLYGPSLVASIRICSNCGFIAFYRLDKE